MGRLFYPYWKLIELFYVTAFEDYKQLKFIRGSHKRLFSFYICIYGGGTTGIIYHLRYLFSKQWQLKTFYFSTLQSSTLVMKYAVGKATFQISFVMRHLYKTIIFNRLERVKNAFCKRKGKNSMWWMYQKTRGLN